MTRDEAIEVARAFIATQPKDWRQEWPAKRLAVKLTVSRQTKEEVWEVRSVRDGLDRSNISVEVSPRTGTVLFALKGGGLRQAWQEYVAPPRIKSLNSPPQDNALDHT
jgi:hypothetical protein